MTGDPSEYDDGDVDGLVDKLEAAFDMWGGGGGGGDTLTVTADIEWAGEYNPRPHRSTRIPGITGLDQLETVTAAAVAARAGMERSRGYRGPTGWAAQFRQLSKSPGGYEAMRAAGVSATLETQRRWLAGDQGPGKANREALDRATRQIHQDRADRARASYRRRAREAVDLLTQLVEDQTGAPVRFFYPSALEFE